ncbi:hypothetical protein C8Q72DRAFT_791525 [Fomitopsis betulina]|nr:hypothetical protein C8Q72DRAFT_791525 [Fomitopsis betulina]
MAPVPASIPAAPSWNSALTVSIGDKKQTIVYTAILVSFIVIFVTGLVYVLRVYITSSVDEESNTSRPPRPPLRIFIPGGSQQCAQSSTSTLVGGGAPPEASQPPFKRSGSGPSPLGQHVHTDHTEQDVVVAEFSAVQVERTATVHTEVTDVVVISPEMDNKTEEDAVSELEVDISDTTVSWLGSGPFVTADSDGTDMLVLATKDNEGSISEEHNVADALTGADAVDTGNAFLQMGEALSPTAESPAKLVKPVSAHRGQPTTDNGTTDSGRKGGSSGTSELGKRELFPFQLKPRRGDVRSTTLDRLARHGTPDDATSTGITEHVATGNAQAREAIDVVKEDGTFKNTSRPAITLQCSYSHTPAVGAKVVSPGTYRSDDAALERTHALAATSVPSYRRPHKEVRFAGDLKAQIGDFCRISFDVGAAYLKVKVAPPVTTPRPLSGDSMYSITDSLGSDASHRLSLLADLALGNDDSVYDTSESSASIVLSIISALATHSSSGESLASLSIPDPVSAAQHIGTGECGSIIIAEEDPDEDANNCHLGPSESSQALHNRILKDCQRILAERRRKFQEQDPMRREEADKVYASFCERRRQHRLLALHGTPATVYPPPLPPDVGGYPDSNNHVSDRHSPSPATLVFGPWSGARTPSPPLENLNEASTEAYVWTFLPGNTGPGADVASPSSKSHDIIIQYKVGEEVPLPPRRAFTISPSDEEMKPVINIEENLDENAERNLHDLGISCSTQALRNLIMRDCKEAKKRRRLEFEACMAARQAERAKQVVAILNEPGS